MEDYQESGCAKIQDTFYRTAGASGLSHQSGTIRGAPGSYTAGAIASGLVGDAVKVTAAAAAADTAQQQTATGKSEGDAETDGEVDIESEEEQDDCGHDHGAPACAGGNLEACQAFCRACTGLSAVAKLACLSNCDQYCTTAAQQSAEMRFKPLEPGAAAVGAGAIAAGTTALCVWARGLLF